VFQKPRHLGPSTTSCSKLVGLRFCVLRLVLRTARECAHVAICIWSCAQSKLRTKFARLHVPFSDLRPEIPPHSYMLLSDFLLSFTADRSRNQALFLSLFVCVCPSLSLFLFLSFSRPLSWPPHPRGSPCIVSRSSFGRHYHFISKPSRHLIVKTSVQTPVKLREPGLHGSASKLNMR